jgi:large conductance mechanosensitive channel
MASPLPSSTIAPPPAPAAPRPGVTRRVGGAWSEFREFAFTGNVVDLAIGVVLGASFNAVVQAVVSDLITPLIGLIGGNTALADTTVDVGGAQLAVGDLANTAIYFLVTALVLFAVVKAVAKVRRQPAAPSRPTRPCRYCLEDVPTLATRCRHCTSVLVDPNGPAPALGASA